ncbi:MAG TPA: D-alanyl-D-alanine carboxypeptidase family protein [Thermoanaerobaculia bacterium]|jgi:D-alanyl-D-alanine carboxypeptidase (penicillin-binding protein 5/6)|nr:D-alanyl-D-alanine carboxypeptidase family protein [Thermoanaerobaculia bacterium]
MRKALFALMIAMLAISVSAQNPEESGPVSASVANAPKGYTSAFVLEPSTGRVLFEDNADKALPTASMAKMMTLLIVMEEIQQGNLNYDTPVTISARASKMGGSQIYLRAGSVWPVKNLLIATMVHSANDAASALAEKVAGSGESFADLMNARAEQLGLKNSRFYDPHGLPAEDPSMNDVMSARDLAKLGQELMKHPFMRQLAVIPEMEFRNGTLERIYNPNRLLRFYEGATGIKTGYSGPAGFSITASAKRNNMELIAVVMGAKTSRGPESSFEIAARLMNKAFLQYKMVTPVKQGAVVAQASVNHGRAKSVPVMAATDVRALVKRGEEKGVTVKFNGGAVAAPIKKGQRIGTIVVQRGNETLATMPAVAAQDVEKQPWWKALLPF